MEEILHHPVVPTLLTCLLAIWPIVKIYARVGFPKSWGFWSLSIFASLLIPYLGLLLVCAPLALKPWPKFPSPPKPAKPVKTPI